MEPKTVRIVKRESTERKKDRFPASKKSTSNNNGSSGLSYVAEDEMESDRSDIENEPPPMPEYSKNSASLPRNYGRVGLGERVSIMSALTRPHHAAISVANSSLRPSNLPLRSKQSNWKANVSDSMLHIYQIASFIYNIYPVYCDSDCNMYCLITF